MQTNLNAGLTGVTTRTQRKRRTLKLVARMLTVWIELRSCLRML